MGTKQTYLMDISGVTDASGDATLRTNRLRSGQLLCVQLVSVRSDDTNNVLAHVSVERNAGVYSVETIAMTNSGYTYSSDKTYWLPSDAQLRIDVEDGGSNEPVYAYVFGYLTDPN
jgi:hypothetical protein